MIISFMGMQISQSYEVDLPKHLNLLLVVVARCLYKTKKVLYPSQILLVYNTE